MLRQLLESRPARPRTRSAAVLSLVVHVAIVTTAVAATRIADEPPPAPTVPDRPIVFIPQPPPAAPAAPAAARPPRSSAPAPRVPTIPMPTAPVEVPSTLPPVDLDGPLVPFDSAFGPVGTVGTPDGVPGGDPAAVPGADAGPMWAEAVTRAARPLGAPREPRYPEPLRHARTEGEVIARYVVDERGRVEPESFIALEATHPLFAQAVRQAVLAQRFRPAEWNGRTVRQLVEQRFVFALRR